MNIRQKFFQPFLSFILILVALTVALPAYAGDLVVTRYFSGLWDQPKQESQGIVLTIIDQEENGNPKAVAYWFTYGDDLETAWYIAIGHVEDNQVLMTLYSAAGVAFMEDDDPDVSPADVAGELILTFRNCNHGTASYEFTQGGGEPPVGEFDIKRLAGLYNARCSGGISDNTPGNAKPVMMEVQLLPPTDEGMGEGKAKFWERSDRSDFIVSAEGIADGDYRIHVCGNDEGPLVVSDGEGSTHFRSSQDEDDEPDEDDDKILLTFEPQGCPVDIRMGDSVALTSGDNVVAEKQHGNGQDKDKGKEKTEVDLENTGVIPEAEGEVEYETHKNSAEFEVEIEDVPAGSYGFFVDGDMKDEITVNEDGGKGKLKFSDPQKDGQKPLDFIPWGLPMEVRQGDTAILQVDFPPE